MQEAGPAPLQSGSRKARLSLSPRKPAEHLDTEGVGVCMVFPVLFGFEVCSTFTVLKMCVLGYFPKQTDRQWVGPGPQPNSDFMLMIWGSIHLPDDVPGRAQETLGMLALGCTSLLCKCGPMGLPQL